VEETETKKILMAWWFFVLTLLLEAPVVYYGYRQQWRKAVLPFLLINLFTWPLLHYLLLTTDIDINIMEAGVVLVEATGYFFLVERKVMKAFVVSLLANGLSYGAGLIITHFFFE
jgi:hypothetical protein